MRTPSPSRLPVDNADLEMGSAARERGTVGASVPRRSSRARRAVDTDVGEELARALHEGTVIADAALVQNHGLEEAVRVEFKAPNILKASCKAGLFMCEVLGVNISISTI